MSSFLNKPEHYYSDGTCKRFPNGRSCRIHIISLSMPTKPRRVHCVRDSKEYNEIEYWPDQDEREFKITIFDDEGEEIWYQQHYNHGGPSYKSCHHESYNDPDITTKVVIDEQKNTPMTEYILQFGFQNEKETFIKMLLMMGGKIIE